MKLTINDLPLYKFFVQVGFTATVVFFCMFSLTFPQQGSQRNQALYASLLSFLTGFWMPSPGSKLSQENQVAIDMAAGGEVSEPPLADSEETNVIPESKQ